MIGQLQFTPDGQVKGKVEIAIQRLKAFEPEEGYYVAFSGGKDSQWMLNDFIQNENTMFGLRKEELG